MSIGFKVEKELKTKADEVLEFCGTFANGLRAHLASKAGDVGQVTNVTFILEGRDPHKASVIGVIASVVASISSGLGNPSPPQDPERDMADLISHVRGTRALEDMLEALENPPVRDAKVHWSKTGAELHLTRAAWMMDAQDRTWVLSLIAKVHLKAIALQELKVNLKRVRELLEGHPVCASR